MQIPINATRVFARWDWLTFTIAFAAALAVYLFTLSSDIDLESSGIYATAAMNGGVGCPPGYPQWTLITWVFVHVLPVGNIAWRISLSSAVEGALATGLIALVGCKSASVVIKQLTANAPTRNAERIALVTGCVGALAFGFSNDFWSIAITVGVQAFNVLLFCFVMALLLRWIFHPTERRHLYAAFFFYGITIVSGQSFISTALGMQFVVALGDRALGRDLLLFNGTVLLIGLALNWFGWFPMLNSTILALYSIVTVATLVAATILVIVTRNAFSEWKPVAIACGLMTLATLTYFIVPVLSMTNPPVNWAYPRTVEGFFHLLMRGQFERLNPTTNVARLLQQLKMYAEVTWDDFGWYYLPFAIGCLFSLKKLNGSIRVWIIAVTILFVTTTVLMVDVTNPSTDRQTLGLLKTYFNEGYLLLAILTACGMAALCASLVKPKTEVRHVSN